MILYKYYSLSKRSADVIKNNEIYFSTLNQLNDPFEMAVRPTFDVPIELKRKHFANDESFTDLSTEEEKERIQLYENHWEKHLNLSHYLRSSNKNLGLFCMSSDPNNILMWSHYADGHKGFCIGYDISIEAILSNAFEVRYEDQPRELSIYEAFTPKEFLTFKYKAWSYENEYRVISSEAGIKKLTCSSTICEVHFGLDYFNLVASKKRDHFGNLYSDLDIVKYVNKIPGIKFLDKKRIKNGYQLKDI